MINKIILTSYLVFSSSAFARNGGDDVGNGGFAYRQSVILLKMATAALEEKIRDSHLPELLEHPERRLILQDTLGYTDIDKLSKKDRYRGGRKLAMDYTVNPPSVIVLKPYFEAFMGTTDANLESTSLEVQKRLLHEAAHIWGYNEDKAEEFAKEFLAFKNKPERPSFSFEINSNFCSCINGVSDIINDCNNFCRTKPATAEAILYVDTIPNEEIVNNPKFRNLYNWCNVQLKDDVSAPMCTLEANDGNETIKNIPVYLTPGSNRFSANISQMRKDRTYVFSVVESKSGSNARTKEAQIRRKSQPRRDELGAIKISPVGMYSCLFYGGRKPANGSIVRSTEYVRKSFFLASGESARPIPRSPDVSLVVCHDEQLYPGYDSILYPRLEFDEKAFWGWDKRDEAFQNNTINSLISRRVLEEYGTDIGNVSLFNPLSLENDPMSSARSVSYVLTPFRGQMGKAFCPTNEDYSGANPILNVLGDYISDTEALYKGESEPIMINDGIVTTYHYNNVYVPESQLAGAAFVIKNGEKVQATKNDFHHYNVYFYFPFSEYMDPLVSNGRYLYTVRGNEGSVTSDKRIGCVPRN